MVDEITPNNDTSTSRMRVSISIKVEGKIRYSPSSNKIPYGRKCQIFQGNVFGSYATELKL